MPGSFSRAWATTERVPFVQGSTCTPDKHAIAKKSQGFKNGGENVPRNLKARD